MSCRWWVSSSRRSSGRLRRARSPAWTPGWSVLTRPPRISGKPLVSSVTGSTSRDASSSARRVAPVEYNSNPSRVRPRAKAGSPALLLTERRARLGNEFDRLREDSVLLGLDAGVQALDRVVGQHGDGRLEQDRTGIHVVGHDVDGAPGELHAVGER